MTEHEQRRKRYLKRKQAKQQGRRKKLIIGVIVLAAIAVIIVCLRWIMPLYKDRNEPLKTENGTDKTVAATNQEKEGDTFSFKDVHGKEYTAPILEEVPKMSYDFSRLEKRDGLYYYKDETGNIISKVGIDVSKYQGDIDWKKVKAAGAEFAILRVGYRGYGTEGNIKLDEKFEDNMKGATEAGLDVGVYFFSQAVTKEEAVEEADFVLEHTKDYSLAYPIVFDTEIQEAEGARTADVDKQVFTDACIAFCDRILEAGQDTMIYYNMVWATGTLDLTKLTKYDKWYADYYEEPQGPYDFKMWQYTETGRISGIEGNVDWNILLQE